MLFTHKKQIQTLLLGLSLFACPIRESRAEIIVEAPATPQGEQKKATKLAPNKATKEEDIITRNEKKIANEVYKAISFLLLNPIFKKQLKSPPKGIDLEVIDLLKEIVKKASIQPKPQPPQNTNSKKRNKKKQQD